MKAYIISILMSISLITLFSSCQEKLLDELIIYSNDFSSMDLNGLTSDVGLFPYNGNYVFGIFNNQGFKLTLDNLPDHNMVKISLDLYVHNYWNGNSQDIDGPDIWKLFLDEKNIINTTFANTFCGSTYCQYQSYPENFARNFPPKTEAYDSNLPGLFEQESTLGWTTLYKIERIISHSQNTLTMECMDQLQQQNVINHIEDESWSVGRIEVSVLNVR